MELTNEALATALRVITAINERSVPDPADIAYLRDLAPLLSNAPTDELAREIIEQAIKRRSRAAG